MSSGLEHSQRCWGDGAAHRWRGCSGGLAPVVEGHSLPPAPLPQGDGDPGGGGRLWSWEAGRWGAGLGLRRLLMAQGGVYKGSCCLSHDPFPVPFSPLSVWPPRWAHAGSRAGQTRTQLPSSEARCSCPHKGVVGRLVRHCCVWGRPCEKHGTHAIHPHFVILLVGVSIGRLGKDSQTVSDEGLLHPQIH